MSDETKKMSLFDLFGQTAETLAQAEEKNKQEQGRSQIERFRMSEDIDYNIRILPLAPEVEKDDNGNIIGVKPLDRKGFEYPLKQLFLSIKLPSKKGKKEQKLSVPVIKSDDPYIGLSDDLITTYVRIAKEKYADDEDLIKKISGGSYGGGLKYASQRAMYVFDLNEKNPKPLLWQASFSMYREIDDKRLRLWRDMAKDNDVQGCPISSIKDAYPVIISRKTKSGNVSYTTDIGRRTHSLTEDDMATLLDAPRIPDVIYHFTRYQLEAEKVFLEQYDEENDIDITNEQEFIDCFNKLSAELPKDDTSHFDLASASKEKEDGDGGKVTIDSLFKEYDAMADKDLPTNSEEYQDFREKIRQFAEDNDIDVRLSRSMNNLDMLEAIEDALDSAKKETKPAKKEEKNEDDDERPARRPSRPKPEDDDVEKPEIDDNDSKGVPEKNDVDKRETPVDEIMPRRRTRRR